MNTPLTQRHTSPAVAMRVPVNIPLRQRLPFQRRPDATEHDLGTAPAVRLWDIEKELQLGMQWSMALEVKYLTENLYILLKGISDRASRDGIGASPTLAMYSMGVSLAKALGRLGWTELRSHFEAPFRERMSELWMDRIR
jgi:hypothetical protein